MVEQWNSVGGTVMVEQWKSVGGTVWCGNGLTVEQWNGVRGRVVVEQWNSGTIYTLMTYRPHFKILYRTLSSFQMVPN